MGYYIEEVDLNNIHSEVMRFIKGFKSIPRHPEEIVDVFTGGYCYWFAFILKERFKYANPHIMYNGIEGHFACMIRDCKYDIRGIIPAEDSVNYEYWEEYKIKDKESAERIIRDCILKIPVNE